MLKPDEAKARLAEWELSEGDKRIARAIEKLPAKLQSLAEPLFNIFDDSKEPPGGWEKWQAERIRATMALDQMDAKERAKVLAVISPQLADALEGAWQLLRATPYQSGYAKQAFRAPGREDLVALSRCEWMSRFAVFAGLYRAEILTPGWLATWAPHAIHGYGPAGADIGLLLAAVLNSESAESDKVFEILRQSIANEHPIGGMGRHVYTAFLLAKRPAGWELVEKTLLAAQRQEGLRQAILESIDFLHPEAFRRMLRLILEHDLVRFSAVVRAVDVWFGQMWAAASSGIVKKMLAQVVEYLDDPVARNKALAGKDPEAAFLALCCTASEDAVGSVQEAAKLLASPAVEMRYVAVRHLANLRLDVAAAAVMPALDDPDLRVASLALTCHYVDQLPQGHTDDRFERTERLVARTPEKSVQLKAIVWPWTAASVERAGVAASLVDSLGHRPAARLVPYLQVVDADVRYRAVRTIVEAKSWSEETRRTIFDLAGDASSYVRMAVFAALADEKITVEEIKRLEAYLTRKASDLRLAILSLLLKQEDEHAAASGQRLLAAKDANQRLAGLEVLRLLCESGRSVAECRKAAAEYRASRKAISPVEQTHLDEIAKERVSAATLENGLGLFDPVDCSPVVAPRMLKVQFVTPASVSCLRSLDELVHEHRETTIQYETYSGIREELLGNVTWGFPSPGHDKPKQVQRHKLPLAEVWSDWATARKRDLRDEDGLELLRAAIWLTVRDDWQENEWTRWAKKSAARKKAIDTLSGAQEVLKLRYPQVVGKILEWSEFLAPVDARDYLLDATEAAFALVPPEEHERLTKPRPDDAGQNRYLADYDEWDWREVPAFQVWDNALTGHLASSRQQLTTVQKIRRWQLLHWCDQPRAGAARRRVEADILLAAYEEGGAKLADFAEHLLGPRGQRRYGSEGFDLLSRFTTLKPSKEQREWLAARPEVQTLVDQAVSRVLEIELSRGDSITAATGAALCLTSLSGTETLRRILKSLGQAEFSTKANADRRYVFTALAKVTFPAADESTDDFCRTMRRAVENGQYPEERLLQLIFLAPQWSKYIEAYFAWPHLSEGMYWFLAHMRYVWGLTDNAATTLDGDDSGDEDDADSSDANDTGSGESSDEAGRAKKLSAWERLILERTPLTDAERNEGAIDVAWFQRTHELLGEKRWQALAAAARFAANPAQAKRAQFIADVLLNRIKRHDLISGIKKKQLKDHVRLLGLLPLATGKKREADLIERCQVLREYRRYANKLSGLTKPAALRAWEIGMKNLAQMAGYADPLRLEWAAGVEAVKDLAKGPIKVNKDGITISLALDELSKPEITIHKGEKELKSIPPALKKDKRIVEITSRATDLKRQASAIRQSLEAAMCRGDVFAGEELRSWCGHALLAPLLSRLIVVGEGIMGYPDKGGKALRDFRGKLEPVKSTERLRLAHPHDFLEASGWHAWQRECFQAERVQPFKQVFRELYVVTKQEKKDGAISHRYEGQQVQPKQALALFGSRGWNTQDGIFKVFHDATLTASVHFESGVFTPLEVEGATLTGVSFTPRDQWKPVPLKTVPPRLFSEVMRDLDLVVSVAHAGGVDPEASALTVEMCAGLLRETCSLLKLKNVRLKPAHAVIDGELANYSVHLGSGVVHKMPGSSLCIVPVHAQHRGRLFLPFADDDPRTAEVVSKVLLLARDHEIQDPTILEQVRR